VRARRALVAAGAGLLIASSLAACGPTAPMPTPTASGSSTPSPAPTSVRNELDPELRPGQPAAANQQFFDAVNQELQAREGRSTGETIVNTLAGAGFDKAAMEVTYDATALGLQADSIVVSVRIGEECLIGQFYPDSYTGTIAPVLSTGKCLVGWQRPIDF
jgi:hypothetical protein